VVTEMLVDLPDGLLGREVEIGRKMVTAAMIEAYADAVGDEDWRHQQATGEAPPTFCLSLYRGMQPAVRVLGEAFTMYGGHDIELIEPIRAGETYTIRARIVDVFDKSGRSGVFTVVVRQASICDAAGKPAARITERQIVRQRREG
jgi:acyl dehydratase